MKLEGQKIIECHECQSTIFLDGILMLKKSKFLTGDERDSVSQVPVLYCKNCGEIIKFMADDISEILKLEKTT